MTKRTSNPRPRKYASASERQAAYRDRAPEVCFRAEPKTVETLDRIADTIDRSRAELLLSMTKFALTNHDWERFGLTHKPLPFEYGVNPIMATKNPIGNLANLKKRYQTVLLTMADLREALKRRKKGLPDDDMQGYSDAEISALITKYQGKAQDLREAIAMYEGQRKANPTSKRTPTPAQLAARERFAEMARAGSFKKAGGRKSNPAASGPVKMKIRGSETLDNPEGLIVTEAGALRWAKQNMPKDLKRAGFVPSVVAGARGWSINYGAAVPGHSTYSRNPAEAGRVRGNPARPGVPYRNQAPGMKTDDPAWVGYAVHKASSPGSAYAILPSKTEAISYARELADRKNVKMGVTRIKYNVRQG